MNQFKELNLKAVMQRANELLINLKELQLSNDDVIQLARAQQHKQREDSDYWECLAWHMVELEILERQIRVEDLHCESNSKNEPFNGGFNI